MALALASILAEAALRHPERTALIAGPNRIYYADLWEQARRYAACLRERGIAPGDRVAIMIHNDPEFPRAYYGILALGAVVVPVHALLTGSEVAYVLRDADAKLLVCSAPLLAAGLAGAREAGIPCLSLQAPADDADGDLGALAAGIAPLAGYEPREPEDEAVILYTSGTTGAPKGAVLTQSNLVLNATTVAFDLVPMDANDVFFGALPLFHSFGQTEKHVVRVHRH